MTAAATRPLKVTLSTHGGLAATVRRAPVVIEGSSLSPAAARELQALIDAATETLARELTPASDRRMPDAQSYVVTVERDRDILSLTGADLNCSPEFESLRDWILHHAAP